jgi:structure-specific recognition protein 1
LHVFGGSSLKT